MIRDLSDHVTHQSVHSISNKKAVLSQRWPRDAPQK